MIFFSVADYQSPPIGVAFANVKGMLFPVVGLGYGESEIIVNFGKSKFMYEIADHDWTAEESAAAIRNRTWG